MSLGIPGPRTHMLSPRNRRVEYYVIMIRNGMWGVNIAEILTKIKLAFDYELRVLRFRNEF